MTSRFQAICLLAGALLLSLPALAIDGPIAPTPEPATIALVGVGAAGLLIVHRIRKNKK